MDSDTVDTSQVPPLRAATVRARLAEAMEGLSLRKTLRRVNAAASELGEKGFNLADVQRSVEKQEGRSGRPLVRYVRAFAHAFQDGGLAQLKGFDENSLLAYLLAEDVLPYSAAEVRKELTDAREARARQLRRPARTEADVARDTLRGQVAATLRLASHLPFPQLDARDPLPRDTLAWILDDLQRVFWEAFWNRGLSDTELLERAWDFAAAIPSPPALPPEGFLRYAELDERGLRRWWLLQSEALRALARPNDFDPNDMNLGRLGEGGHPIPWRDWVRKWDETPKSDRAVALGVARGLKPDEAGVERG